MMNDSSRHPDLLSVDVEAHLQKISANTFRSPHYYPVEIIRSALRRGARKVNVEIHRDSITFKDDGSGISPRNLEDLVTILDYTHTSAERENAMEQLLNLNDIGLLVLFSPGPARIVIENRHPAASSTIEIKQYQSSIKQSCTIDTGTKISIHRKKSNWQEEYTYIKEYCGFTDADITVNKKQVEHRPLLRNSMVSTKIYHEKSRINMWLSIPYRGDVCRIWLLEEQIPFDHINLAAQQGYIFEAAIEQREPINSDQLVFLIENCHKLYSWLSNRYTSYPNHVQERVEYLLFTQYSRTKHASPINLFAPFRALTDPLSYLNLNQVMDISRKQKIYTQPAKKISSSLNSRDDIIFQLTHQQIDFLHNVAHVPIHYLNDQTVRWIQPRRYKQYFQKFVSVFQKRPKTASGKIVPRHHLREKEKLFLDSFDQFFSNDRLFFRSRVNRIILPSEMIDRSGIFPAYLLLPKQRGDRATVQVVFNRRHDKIVKAIQAVAADPQNIDWLGFSFFKP